MSGSPRATSGRERALRKLAHGFIVFLAIMWAVPQVWAQAYPARPVRLIVPFAAGGTADILARLMAQKLTERLEQPFVVENRTGAAGNIGTDLVAKAPADGYTLLLAFDGTLVINPSVYAKMPFDTLKDLAPISMLARVPIVIVAHPSFPPNNVREFIAYAKQHPGLDYASAGIGSTTHLAVVMIEQQAGIKLTHIAYKGGAQGAVDVVSGQVPLLTQALPGAQPFLKSGKLKAIGMTVAKRHPSAPDIETFAEGGLAGFDVSTWFGLAAPAGTPAPIIEKLHQAVAGILAEPEMRLKLQNDIGADAVGDSPAEFAASIRHDLAAWGKVVRSTGLRIE